MKLAVFGPTGGTGREVVAQALARGHEVTAFARTPAAIGLAHERLRAVAGDAFDAGAVARAVEGQEAVISSLGTRPWRYRPICSGGTENIVKAMERHGLRRLVVVSSWGTGETRAQAPALLRSVVFNLLIKREIDDKERMEEILRRSSLDWVVLRPVFLTNGAPRGDVRAALDGSIRGGFIRRADVARFALDQVASDAFLRQAPVIAG